MKIYTKTGDKGKTRLVGGCLVSKSDLRVEAYGSIDELNSYLGLILPFFSTDKQWIQQKRALLRIQNELFNLGSLFACEKPEIIDQLPPINNSHIENLEKEIDQMSEELPPLKNFILPGGSALSAHCHVSRSLCRRAERRAVQLMEKHPEVELGMIYLNRLSDYLFTLARYCNWKMGIEDQHWQK